MEDELTGMEAAEIVPPVTECAEGQSLVVLVKDESGNYCICFDIRMASRAGLD